MLTAVLSRAERSGPNYCSCLSCLSKWRHYEAEGRSIIRFICSMLQLLSLGSHNSVGTYELTSACYTIWSGFSCHEWLLEVAMRPSYSWLADPLVQYLGMFAFYNFSCEASAAHLLVQFTSLLRLEHAWGCFAEEETIIADTRSILSQSRHFCALLLLPNLPPLSLFPLS